MDILVEKHPPDRAVVSDSLLESYSVDTPCYDPVLFEQSDLHAMAMYVLAVTPFIDSLRNHHPNISQAWFADDATAAGQLIPLLQWWKQLLPLGPLYGYHPNDAKTYLIVKPQLYDSAKQIF